MYAKHMMSQRCDTVSKASMQSRLAMCKGGAPGLCEWCWAVSSTVIGSSGFPPCLRPNCEIVRSKKIWYRVVVRSAMVADTSLYKGSSSVIARKR